MYFNKLYLSALIIVFAWITSGYSQETPWSNIGPFLGYINSMASENAHPDTLYAATPYGVYKSADAAANWIMTGLIGIEINAVEVSAVDPELVIASSDSIVYKSENGGDTWSEIFKSERTIGAIALDPDDEHSIWAGVHVPEYKVYTENLFHSADGGANWDPVPFATGQELKLQTVKDIHFDCSDHSVIYVAGWGDTYHVDGGLMVSQDGGATWTNFRLSGCSSNTVVDIESTPAGFEEHVAYALVGPDCGTDREMYRSLDHGTTWEPLWAPFDMDEQRWAGETMLVELQDPEWLLVGGWDGVKEISVFLYNSLEDAWYAWTNSPFSYPTAIVSHPEGNFLGFEKNGVLQNYYTQENGNTWIGMNSGMNNVEILDLITYPDGSGKLMAAAAGNLARTTDGGYNWYFTSNSFTRLALNEQDTSVVYGGKKVTSHTFMSPFYAYKTENGGDSWASQKIFTNSGMLDYYYTLWVGDILVSPDDPQKILIGIDGGGACGEGLYLSGNGGDSWSSKFTTGVSALAMDPVDHDVLYLGTTSPGYVAQSENGGLNWEMISPTGGSALASSVRSLAVDRNQQVFAATSAGLYRWEGGTSWTQVNGVPEINTPSLAIDNRPATSHLYAGTEGQGIFVSRNGGSSWESFNNGMGTFNITRLKIDGANPPHLVAGTKDGGVWITELEEVATSVPVLKDQEGELEIYPNPSRGEFRIRSKDGTPLKGSLRITNMLGEVVHDDPDLEIPAGQGRTITMDPVAPGPYILLFKNSTRVITRKILVEKR